MCWRGHAASGMAVLVGDDSGATLLTGFRLRLSCFRETSKWVGGANHVEMGGSKNFLTHINLSEHVSS